MQLQSDKTFSDQQNQRRLAYQSSFQVTRKKLPITVWHAILRLIYSAIEEKWLRIFQFLSRFVRLELLLRPKLDLMCHDQLFMNESQYEAASLGKNLHRDNMFS